jgi:hypothetical protein
MGEKISFQDADGKRLSGRFKVSHGMITVIAHDGRTKTVEIEESMLRPWQKCSYFNCIGRGDRPVDPRRSAAHRDQYRQAAGVGA